jgi:hypothetical protein
MTRCVPRLGRDSGTKSTIARSYLRFRLNHLLRGEPALTFIGK